jgi:hypothetical protein
MVPAYVKEHYSPRDSWKDKPFEKEDVRFFSKGVKELSELFTEERPEQIPAYFQHPKYRSAYLLYFLPLQMAKFVSLYEMHTAAVQAALDHGRKQGVLRIADLGAGPGTASIGFLLRLLQTRGGDFPPIELYWFDTQRAIMEDGKALVQALSDQFPRLRGKVTVHLQMANWWDAPAQLKSPMSLILLGHVMNEAKTLPNRFKAREDEEPLDLFDSGEGPVGNEDYDGEENEAETTKKPKIETIWAALLKKAEGGGVLFVEPAAKTTSQFLSRLRNRLFQTETIEKTATMLWGPCPHAETCPLSYGKDYCHFSVPTRVPGRWFAEFSKALGSERLWLKFSYLWITSKDQRSPKRNPSHKLVISDPLSKAGDVLICEPERPGRLNTARLGPVWRGDVLQVGGTADGAKAPSTKPVAGKSFTAKAAYPKASPKSADERPRDKKPAFGGKPSFGKPKSFRSEGKPSGGKFGGEKSSPRPIRPGGIRVKKKSK